MSRSTQHQPGCRDSQPISVQGAHGGGPSFLFPQTTLLDPALTSPPHSQLPLLEPEHLFSACKNLMCHKTLLGFPDQYSHICMATSGSHIYRGEGSYLHPPSLESRKNLLLLALSWRPELRPQACSRVATRLELQGTGSLLDKPIPLALKSSNWSPVSPSPHPTV